MFDWVGKIFASDKSLERGLGILERTGDALFYTDEEKAIDRDNMARHKDTMIMAWIESSKGANMSRRFLAFLVGGLWAFLLIFSWVSQQMAVWSTQVNSEKLALMKEINDPFLEQATGGMLLVLGFYFAAPYMGAIVGTAIEKFTGKKADKPA